MYDLVEDMVSAVGVTGEFRQTVGAEQSVAQERNRTRNCCGTLWNENSVTLGKLSRLLTESANPVMLKCVSIMRGMDFKTSPSQDLPLIKNMLPISPDFVKMT